MFKLPALPPSIIGLLLSPSGAIDRFAFSLGTVVLIAFAVAFDKLTRLATDPAGIVPFLFALGIAWSAGCLCRKRLHDLDRSGWLIIAFLAAYILLVLAMPFILDANTARSWSYAVVTVLAFVGPLVAWFVGLAVMPGETARRAARQAWQGPATSNSVGGPLRAGRM